MAPCARLLWLPAFVVAFAFAALIDPVRAAAPGDPARSAVADPARSGRPAMGISPEEQVARGMTTSEQDAADPPALIPYPLRNDFEIRRTVVGPGGALLDETATTSAAENERLVYSNTLGDFAVFIPNGAFVSDDLTLLAVSGCSLRRYTFQVVGKADPQDPTGGAYRVDFALHDDCPGAGGKPITGAGGFVQFPAGQDNVVQHVEFVVPEGATVTLPSTVWLGLQANRNNVGVIIGAPALVGFSGDNVDFPGFACNANDGGFPSRSQASFNAEVHVDAACAEAFPAYRNLQPGRDGFTEGANKCMADDLALNVDDCNMVAYEVHVRGSGSYKWTSARTPTACRAR